MDAAKTAREYLSRLPPVRELAEDAVEDDPIPGVYVLYRAGQPVYVGQSADCARRVHRQHARSREFDYVEVYHVADESSRLRFEGMLILALTPEENKALNLGIKPNRCWAIRWRAPAKTARKAWPRRKNPKRA